MKKLLTSVISFSVASTLVLGTSFAQSVTDEVYKLPSNTNLPLHTNAPVGNGSSVGTLVETKYPGPGLYFEPSSTTRTKETEFSMEVTNSGAGTTTVTRTVALEKFGQVAVGGEVEFEVMMQKAKANIAFTAGAKKTETQSITWTIPAKSVYTVRAGNVIIKTNGYIETANSSGVVTKRQYNTGTGTESNFSDSIFVRKL